MKKIIMMIFLALPTFQLLTAQNVGIGTNSPNSKALLDISSTTKGVLFPRMTSTQRASIAAPPAGLMLYDTDRKSFFHFDGAIWRIMLNSDYWNRLSTLPNYVSNNTDSIAIGTLIPEERLDVVGNIRSRNNLIATNNVTAGGGVTGGNLTSLGNLLTVGTSILSGDVTTNNELTINNTAAILQLKSNNDKKGFFQLNGNDVRFGTNSGNPGGNVIVRLDGDDIISFEKSLEGAFIRLKKDGVNIGVLQTSTNNVTLTNPNGGRVDLGGEIYINDTESKTGIGTAFPTERLHVSGNTKITGTAVINGKTTVYNDLSAYKTTLGKLELGGGILTAGYDGMIAAGSNTEVPGFGAVAIGRDIFVNAEYATAIGGNIQLGCEGCMALTDGQQGIGARINSGITRDMMFMRFNGGYKLYTSRNSADASGVQMGNGANSWSSISDSTKKEHFKYADGNMFLKNIAAMKLGSWNYKTQDKKTFRHYGPMAQEFFSYFGNDGIGTIGNDTSIATADIDGVIMIALQALINENEALKIKIEKQEAAILKSKEMGLNMQQRLEKIEAIIGRNTAITSN